MTAESAAIDPTDLGPVLIIDDDPLQLRAFARIIDRLGLRPVVSGSAYGVLNLIAETHPSLVVLDVMMPGLDGAMLARLIRADPQLRTTRIVLRSAVDEDSLRVIADGCGADHYMCKTLGATETARSLRRWIGE